MRMLTLHRPWAWCVVYGGKRVENRPMKPPPAVLGHWMAIHAGKTWLPNDWLRMVASGLPVPPEQDHPAGVIVGVCRVIGHAQTADEAARFLLDPGQSRWFHGPFGWLLADVRPLAQPVAARGFQGVPRVPEELLPGILAQTGLEMRADGSLDSGSIHA